MFERDRDSIMLEFALSECRRALGALRNVDLASEPYPHPRHTGEVYEITPVFDNIRLALQSAANVSRMLWPPRNTARGAHLRSLTGIRDSHPLHDRSLRNHVEHVDERLDAWAAASTRPSLAVEIIIPPCLPNNDDTIKMTDVAAIVYEQATRTIHLFGDSFSLDELAVNLADVGSRLEATLALMKGRTASAN